MPWTVLRPSFRSCQVEPQFSSAYPPDKAWTIPRPAHVRPQSALPIFPLTNLQPHKSALTISPTDGMAASTLRPCFGQPAEACTSCTFDTVTNHPHQKNPTPSSDRFEVPLHRICSSSQSMFLRTKPLSFSHIQQQIPSESLSTCFKKPSCDTFCFGSLVFHTCQTHHTRKHVFAKFRCHA